MRQFGRVLDRRHLDRRVGLAVGGDDEAVAFDGDGRRKSAMDRVIAQQMRIGFHRTQVVDRNHFDIRAIIFDDRAQDIAADTAKTVDGDT